MRKLRGKPIKFKMNPKTKKTKKPKKWTPVEVLIHKLNTILNGGSFERIGTARIDFSFSSEALQIISENDRQIKEIRKVLKEYEVKDKLFLKKENK